MHLDSSLMMKSIKRLLSTHLKNTITDFLIKFIHIVMAISEKGQIIRNGTLLNMNLMDTLQFNYFLELLE
jgi:hypothetical protein